VSTSAERSGASRRSASTVTSSPVVCPRSTNSTKPGHAALASLTGAPVSAIAWTYAPDEIVPTVPITATRPVVVAWTSALAPGRTTSMIGTGNSSRRSSSPAAVAVLQATTIAFAS
jgi:hypothetical protein